MAAGSSSPQNGHASDAGVGRREDRWTEASSFAELVSERRVAQLRDRTRQLSKDEFVVRLRQPVQERLDRVEETVVLQQPRARASRGG